MTAASLPLAMSPAPVPLAERSLGVPAMGGSLVLHVAYQPDGGDRGAAAREADRDLLRVARRVERWAARLTRFSGTSDLVALNGDPARPDMAVRPTLAAVLDWAERATGLAPGLLDVTLLDERLAAERGPSGPGAPVPVAAHDEPTAPTAGPRRWHLVRGSRGATVVRREPCRFDLDGVAKGWIADRALELLRGHPAALVDADGDIALRIGAGITWDIGIADPRDPDGQDLALLRLDGRSSPGRIGIATSGTSVHRWGSDGDGRARHHLIDPRTRRPARTDVVQATVIAASARAAEVLAKAAVIAGSDDGLALLDRDGVEGALLLLEDGGLVCLPRTTGWLA